MLEMGRMPHVDWFPGGFVGLAISVFLVVTIVYNLVRWFRTDGEKADSHLGNCLEAVGCAMLGCSVPLAGVAAGILFLVF
jgi:hypothetical protein